MAENTAASEEEVKKETTEDTSNVEETPQQEVEETQTETTESEDAQETTETTETSEQEFDAEEFKKQTIAETQKAVFDKIAGALGMDKKDETKAKEEGLVPPWEKRGESRPKSWKEHAEYSADLAEWKRQQQEQEIKRTQEEQEKEAKEQRKRWYDYWDTELDDLTKKGQLPKVENPDDPNDPGRRMRIEIFAKMQEVRLQRQKDGLPPITSVELIYHKFKDEFNEEPAGADAPVSFGKKGVSNPDSKDEYSYHDIHNKSIDQIKDGK